MSIEKVIDTFLDSLEAHDFLDFKLYTKTIDISKFHPEKNESFEQDVIKILPSYKDIASLPTDAHKDWTLESYKEMVKESINLKSFTFYVFYNDIGVEIFDEHENLVLKVDYNFLNILT